MRIYPPAKRLEDAKNALQAVPFRFGLNKEQELVRLLFEVSRRENIPPSRLMQEATGGDGVRANQRSFSFFKEYLLSRRYPHSFTKKNSSHFYLPKINFDNRCIVRQKRPLAFYPETIFIEQDAQQYPFTETIVKQFPRAKKISITTVKCYRESQKRTAAQAGAKMHAYNERAKTLFLIKERYDFLKPCPCTQGAIRCGYHVVNLGFGCVYDCSYCFLQGYANSEGIILPVNSGDFLKRIERTIRRQKGMVRMGTGEFSDSLALDHVTGFGRMLVEFFSRFENARIELKTKSANVRGLLSLPHNDRSVIAWSLNPQPVIETDEWKTSSLEERLRAAQQCLDAGYVLAFHFDPIIYSAHWERHYRHLIETLFSALKGKEKNVAWISLGTLRCNPRLKTVIEQRFPESALLDAELMLEFDSKLRYSNKLRRTIYTKMHSWIRKHSRSVPVYLCMEPQAMWKDVLSRNSFY